MQKALYENGNKAKWKNSDGTWKRVTGRAYEKKKANNRKRFNQRYKSDPAFRRAHNERTKLTAKEKRGCWGTCAICRTGPTMLHRDHNHVTGQQRDKLCPHCNWLLGHCKEQVKVLQAAVRYLKKWKKLK